ncbi:MAG: chemotaxis protein CheD [Deltaproteobacteria bacterium]|nr:chemotaxis protein CheD [Deltaproteobacteria bacterium]
MSSPLRSSSSNSIKIGISEMVVSKDIDAQVITYALGSCIGLVLYDPKKKCAGMLHYQLPSSKGKPDVNPFMYADTGVPKLFQKMYKQGCKKENIIVKVAGGANINDANGIFDIGKRNYLILRKMLWKNDVLITSEEVGGNIPRTLSIEIASGLCWVQTGRDVTEL